MKYRELNQFLKKLFEIPLKRKFCKYYCTLKGEEWIQFICNSLDSLGKEKVLKFIEECSSKKRIKWYKENKERLEKSMEEKNVLRKAYEIVMLNYMTSNPEEIVTAEESENRIVWKSYNPCPVLEVCKRKGLDTREVCKKAYEKPAQIFFQQIDKRIKYGRNYEKIRPYSEYCEEFIELMK